MDLKVEKSDFFGLITDLCKTLMEKSHNKYSSKRNNTQVINEMRTTAFEILLNKHKSSRYINDNQQIDALDPMAELLKYSFVLRTTFKLHSSATKLEQNLDYLIDDDGNCDPTIKSVIYFLHCLKNYQSSANDNLEPFHIGGMHPPLPESHQWHNEVPQYQIYPLSILELPIQMNKLLYRTNEKFDTIDCETPFSGLFQLPIGIMNCEISLTSAITPCNLKLQNNLNNIYNKINGNYMNQLPWSEREIDIENVDSNKAPSILTECDLMSTNTCDLSSEIECRTWETLGNKEIPEQPSFILDSSIAQEYFENIRNFSFYSNETDKCRNKQCNIITMEKFIENTKLALLGISSNCYVWNNALGFVFDVNTIVSGLSRESSYSVSLDITRWATCFKLLSLLVHPNAESGELRQDGLIFKAMCNNIEDILIHYQAVILQVFNHNNSYGLLSLINQLRDIGLLITEVARLCRCDQVHQTTLGEGMGMLSHIYNQVTRITKPKIALVYYSILKSCCEVYYQLLEKWIFEGICDETYGEFMIKIRGQYIRNRGHKFWTRCFGINNEAVPGFLKNLTDSILQCGKAVRLLKICDPKNPMCNLFSTRRPTVKVCLNMDMLSEQEKICSEYMSNGVEILGTNVTLDSAFREIKAIEKEKADYVIAAQYDTLQRIKRNQEEMKLKLLRNKRELLADQKKQCENAVLRREKDRETTLMEDKLILQHQMIEDEKIKSKQLADAKITLDYYKDLTKEATKRRLRAMWRVQRMSLFDERMSAIARARLDDARPTPNEQLNVIGENTVTAESNINSKQHELFVNNTINDENCNKSEGEIIQWQTIQTDKIRQVTRPTLLEFTKKDVRILADKTTENRSIIGMSLGTEAILNEITQTNYLFKKSRTDICHGITGKNIEINEIQDINNAETINIRNEILSNDNNCNIIIIDEKNNGNINEDNINQAKIINNLQLNSNEATQFPQIIGNDINDATPMSCTTDSYVASSSSVLYNYNEAGSSSECKNEFETPTTPGDCLTANPMAPKFPMENIFTTSSTQCFNPFILDDRSPVIFESSVTKADVEIIDNTSLQVYLEKSVLIPLRVQSHLANSAIVKCLLHDHNILMHFQSLRSFFFLLNGEFAKNLTGPLYTKFYEISLPVELLNSHTLTNLLKNALHCSLNSSYINSELLSLTVFESPSLLQILDPEALNCLCLHYNVSWPLNIIIDESLMQQYSKVFKFLLMVGRVLWVLQEDFCILKNERKASWSHQYHRVQLFRHAMMQFMTALHNYITCSVLHASWTEFEKELENATTLDQIYTTHVSYIKKILSRCMLTNRGEKLRICLCNTFKIILKFHNCLRSYEWMLNSTGYTHPNYKKLEQMYDAFCTLRTYPAQVVDRSASSGYQMHLSHFVDALNINPLFNL